MSRVRSPNYPSIGLATAIEKVRSIHKGEGKNAVAREALAKLIGYGGLNGGSATMLSALNKYGLLEGIGEGEARITDLAMQIIAPDSLEEKQSALITAAFKPAIFSEIREKWPERAPGDDSLRSFLIRKRFTVTALEQVIQFYREIIDMVLTNEPGQDSPSTSRSTKEQAMMSPSVNQPASRPVVSLPESNPLAVEEPYRVSLTRGGIEVKAHLQDEGSADELIKVIQAWKLLLREAGLAKRPAFETADEEK